MQVPLATSAVRYSGMRVAVSVMPNRLIARLRGLTSLSDTDFGALQSICSAAIVYGPQADLVPEGGGTDDIHVLLDGWACRYRTLIDGRRQFPALLVPGDLCDIDGLLLRRIHYGIAALTPCTVALLPHAQLRELMDERPAIREVLWWLTSVENAISAEWTTGLGCRSSEERFAHLLCELMARLTTVGMTEGNSYHLPLTQDQLSYALGISTVHVSRTLHELRQSGLVSLEGRRLTILDLRGLQDLGGFSSEYLHAEGLCDKYLRVPRF